MDMKKAFSRLRWDRTRGFSLVEAIVASVAIAFLIMVSAKLFRGGVFGTSANREAIDAGAFADMVVARLQTISFIDVFAFDSDNKNPTDADLYDAGGPPPLGWVKNPANGNYLMDWDLSRASSTLNYLDQQMRQVGFDRFRVQVFFIRRDSSDQVLTSTISGQVEDYVQFQDINSATSTRDNIDDTDPNLMFKDGDDADSRCYGFISSDTVLGSILLTEVPNTATKLVRVTVFKKGRAVSTRGFFLTKTGLSGAETTTVESPLKLDVTYPPNGLWLFQKNAVTGPHLILPTYRDYWNENTSYYPNIARRVDIDPMGIQIGNTHAAAGDASWFQAGGAGSYFRFKGTFPPNSWIQVNAFSALAPIPNPLGAFIDQSQAGSTGTEDINSEYDTLSAFLTTEGRWNLWTRAFNLGLYSPWDKRSVRVDVNPPFIPNVGPEGDLGGGGTDEYYSGQTPLIWAVQTDTSPANIPVAVSGIFGKISAMNLSDGILPSTWAYTDGVGWDLSDHAKVQSTYNMAAWTASFGMAAWTDHSWFQYLRDNDHLPPQLSTNTLYTVKVEAGDIAMYKSSHAWTFRTQDDNPYPNGKPTITPPAFPNSDNRIVTSSHTGFPSFTWPRNQTRRFQFITLKGLKSGVNLKTFKIECCKEDGSDCHDVFGYPGPLPMGGRFGDYFNFTQVPLYGIISTNDRVRHNASGGGGADNHAANSIRMIKVNVDNWNGESADMPPWKVEIIP